MSMQSVQTKQGPIALTNWTEYLFKIVLLTGMYFGAAWFVTRLGENFDFSRVIFPAAGIALGACLCCGMRMWPGVLLGALAFNIYLLMWVSPAGASLSQGQTVFLVFALSGARLAQTIFGVYLFNRFVSSDNPLNRTKDVLVFIFLVAMLGSAVCSLFSLLTLVTMNQFPLEKFGYEWLTCWLGDVMGVLLVTPLFLVFRQRPSFKWSRKRVIELTILFALFFLTSQLVFGGYSSYHQYPLVYTLFPCLVWAAYRFGHPGAVVSVALVSLAAVWGTLQGWGPFAQNSMAEAMSLLQFYLLILTVMTLILTAAVSEAQTAHTHSSRFGRVLDDSSNEIYLFDAKTLKFVQVNRGARDNLGYSLTEMLRLSLVDIQTDFKRKDIEGLLKPLRRGDKDLVTWKTLHQRRDGTRYPVEVRLQLSHAEVWPVFVAIVQDITEKQRVEDELKGYRNHLEDLVQKRTEDLEAAHRQLLHAEKLSATGKMAASIAHEFNNPIFGIRNILEKIQRRISMDENNTRFVALAIKECDRVSNLIRKILDFHSPSSDEKELMCIHEAIDDMVLLLQEQFKERNILVIKDFDREIPYVDAVPDQIRQVFLNILKNAGEAIHETGGTIYIATSSTDDKVQIRISDSGAGIQEAVMKDIFDPFFTTKPGVKGTGLGLSVSYGIIKKHNGDIRVESVPGRGAIFKIILPQSLEVESPSSPAL